ncbi:MAG: MCE family protein [Candidatus Aminicenantes bacterium]|nr:MCE family protein [Candidatus Aminicenantes bacterium]
MNDRKMTYISGLIVFIAGVLFLICILWLSGNQLFFSDEYKLHVRFEDAVGLTDQAPVFMRGYRIGSTKQVTLEKKTILVTIQVKKSARIPSDSQFEINTLNFLGEKGIMIFPGDSDQILDPGTTVNGTNKDLMALAKNILFAAKEKIEQGNLDQAVAKLSESVDSFRGLIGNMNAKVEGMDVNLYNRQIREIGGAGKELQEFLDVARTETMNLSSESRMTLEKFSRTMDQVNDTLGQLSALSSDLSEIARDINMGRGTAGQLLQNREYIESLNDTIRQLTLFLEDIRKNPKKYVKFSIF